MVRFFLSLGLLCLIFGSACGDRAPESDAGMFISELGGAVAFWPPLETSTGGGSAQGSDEDNPWLNWGGSGSQGSVSIPGENEGKAMPSGSTSFESSGSSSEGEDGTPKGAPGSAVSEEVPPPEPADLIFLAYWESTSSTKLLLVEHRGGGPTENCHVEIYSNGSTEPWRTLDLPDGLEPDSRHLLCIPEATREECDTVFGGSAFNGNDAVRLTCADELLDLIGVVGQDPGEAWSAPGAGGTEITTKDSGLWRCHAPSGRTSVFVPEQWAPWDEPSDSELSGPECPSENLPGGLGGAPAVDTSLGLRIREHPQKDANDGPEPALVERTNRCPAADQL